MARAVWTDAAGRPANLTLAYGVNLRKLGQAMAQAAPSKTGRLRGELRKTSSYQYNARTNRIRMLVDLPYAKIVDQGGRIPARYPVRAKAMHWKTRGGKSVFAKRARGYYYPGQQFTEIGLELWLARTGANENIRPYWGRRRR